jgi:hypothetical protein
MILYAATIFLSAFLLFQLQPIVARAILPWFGGSAAVWTTCMLFFQVALLLGYLYAHWMISRVAARTQALLHGALLAASLAMLPILPSARWKPHGGENPTIAILVLLAATIGLPYFLLSTTSPLVQAWYTRARAGAIPYRLFALSNLGSMLALLSYPPLVEPGLTTSGQAWAWSAGYLAFAALCAALAVKGARVPAAPAPAGPVAPPDGDEAVPARTHLLWAALAACPSAMMLAITNHLTQDVAAIPFLWIVPLAIYLLSFILCFDAPRWYARPLFLGLLPPALGIMIWMLLTERDDVPNIVSDLLLKRRDVAVQVTVALFAVALFVCCMMCHGELARRKPHPRRLTSFYLMISIGGALGGLFVGVVAPYAFPGYFEFPIALALCGTLAVITVGQEPKAESPETSAGVLRVRWFLRTATAGALALGLGALYYFSFRAMWEPIRGYRLAARNFYGAVRVRQTKTEKDWDGYRTFLHGAINHGEQWLHPDRRRTLLTYYCEDTGVGRAIKLRANGEHRVGVMGLGAGTMAAFGRPGDYYRFYEINPLVPMIANTEFTFLRDNPARTEIAMGDARLSMEREPPQRFDLLVMDAFSGDSIPVHLVTREAFELYFRHVKPSGIVAVHISNKYLDLQPVIERAVVALRKVALVIETNEDDAGNCFGTTWVLVTSDPKVLARAEFDTADSAPPRGKPDVRLWTDDYSNLFRILK